jgi:ABC-2 type transport system ATP-binding protein
LTEIRDLIKQNGEKRTVIFSSHILQEVEAVCSRVIIINKGEIVADFPETNGINDFRTNEFHFQVEFLYPINSEKWNEFPQISSIETNDNQRFDLTSKRDIRSEIFDFAVKNSNKIMMMKPLEKGMEEVFRELTTII